MPPPGVKIATGNSRAKACHGVVVNERHTSENFSGRAFFSEAMAMSITASSISLFSLHDAAERVESFMMLSARIAAVATGPKTFHLTIHDDYAPKEADGYIHSIINSHAGDGICDENYTRLLLAEGMTASRRGYFAHFI